LARLRERFPHELVVIGVHCGKFPSELWTAHLREAVMRHGIEHPVLNDGDFAVWQAYAVRAWPTLVLIDPEGYVAGVESGEIMAEEFAPAIERLIAEFDARGTLDRRPLDLRPESAGEPARPLRYPSKLLAAPGERLFVADTGHHRVLEIALSADGLSGTLRRPFGSGAPALRDGAAAEAAFNEPHGLALAGDTLYVADTGNHAVRAIDLRAGSVRTVAGTGAKAHRHYALGAPTATPLRSPWALVALEPGIVFIAMAGSHQIWALLQETQLGPFAGNGREALVDGGQLEASFNQPSDLAFGLGHLFVADAEAGAIRAIALSAEPQVMTLVGQGLFEFGDVDGTGGEVRLQHPTGLAFRPEDNLVYIADSYNHKVKLLDPTNGQVMTVIGSGQVGRADGRFSEAELYEPEGLCAAVGATGWSSGATSPSSLLYIADTNNHAVRVADLATGVLHTLAL
jgi:DNA-binding beta-propeller fold protein YncE